MVDFNCCVASRNFGGRPGNAGGHIRFSRRSTDCHDSLGDHRVCIQSESKPISFYVEYSDDLVDWKPFHIFDSTITNTDPTIITNLTNGQMTLLLDETVSARRFYRAVETH